VLRHVLVVGLAGAALTIAPQTAASASTGTLSNTPVPCEHADCRGPWVYPLEEPTPEYQPPVGSFEAIGRDPVESVALAEAFDRAMSQCPTGIKVTGTDVSFADDRYTVTVYYECPL
jgi:hypothetical protein